MVFTLPQAVPIETVPIETVPIEAVLIEVVPIEAFPYLIVFVNYMNKLAYY